jgi:hypothetical protein
MTLMNLVRSIGVLVIVWTLVAIGIGASGVRLPGPSPAVPTAIESPPADILPSRWPDVERFALVDRTSGRISPIHLPEAYRWAMVSVCPWRGRGGELEAVGRWVNPEGQAFCGWGLFRLTDGAVLRRVATEMLPTGRSCWVPGLPRTILFPAADGQLHRCRLDGEGEDEDSPAPSSRAARGAGPGDAVLWGIRPPGRGDVFLADPVWSDEPRLKKWVIVALSQQVRRGKRFVFGPPDLWWLEVSDGAGSIVAAGRLARAEDGVGSDVEKRFPSVAVDPTGRIRLFYLSRPWRQGDWQLRSAAMVFDCLTGRPMSVGGDGPASGSDSELVTSPLLVSSDAETVFGLSRSGGIAALPVGGYPVIVPAIRPDPAGR